MQKFDNSVGEILRFVGGNQVDAGGCTDAEAERTSWTRSESRPSCFKNLRGGCRRPTMIGVM